MLELWCEECGAKFRNQCTCPDSLPLPEKEERWVGADGHAYVGDPDRASLAFHDFENCACKSSWDF